MLAELDGNSISARSRIDKQIQRGRTTGRYQLSTLNLTKVPDELYSSKQLANVNFWEEVPTQSINLSHNELQELPAELSTLEELKALDVRATNRTRKAVCSYNKVSSLAKLSFKELVSLDVSNNAVRDLGEISISFPALQTLSCGQNPMTKLSLRGSDDMLELCSNKCHLSEVFDGLQGCTGLTKLSLSSNKLRTFPDLQVLGKLIVLDLSHNLLEGRVPLAITNLQELASLNVSQNSIIGLPEGLSSLTQLTELHLSFNALRELPKDVANLSLLQTLDFRDNKIACVPKDLSRLSLSLLDMRNNSIQTLPPELGLINSLKFLGIQGNPIRGIRPTLLAAPVAELLKFLRSRVESLQVETETEAKCELQRLSVSNGVLSLSGEKLGSIPVEIWALGSQIRVLDLSHCGLQAFESDQLSKLSCLQSLILHHNALKDWPIPNGVSQQLRALDLSHNPLQDIPGNALQGLRDCLTSLRLSGVKSVSTARKELFKELIWLQELELQQCGLQEIGTEFCGLSQLQKLDVSSNNISGMPQQLTRLTALTELNISNNSVSRLPPQLGLMHPTLRSLLLEGNPLRTIRQAILQRGTPSVLEYLRGRLPA